MGPMSYIFGPSPLGRSVPSKDGKYCLQIQVRVGLVRRASYTQSLSVPFVPSLPSKSSKFCLGNLYIVGWENLNSSPTPSKNIYLIFAQTSFSLPAISLFLQVYPVLSSFFLVRVPRNREFNNHL